MLNAHSRHFAPAKHMALGTRAPNEPKLTDVYAGLPRDLDTKLAAEISARLGLSSTRKTHCLWDREFVSCHTKIPGQPWVQQRLRAG